MHRVDADGHVGNLFDEGDPAVPTNPTQVDAAILNAFQEELANAVEGGGVTLVKGTNTQLATVLAGLFTGSTPGGRLTLTSAFPVPPNGVSGQPAFYYTEHLHNRIPLYDGTKWVLKTFVEMAQLNTDATKSPAAVANNSNYDVFVWDDAGTLRATRGPAWTSDTARGTGAGTTELERLNGRMVNKIAITNGPAAQRGLYVGTIRSDGAATLVDGNSKMFVWNMYNRVARFARALEATNSWTYTTDNTWRQANASAANQIEMVIGLVGDTVDASVIGTGLNDSTGESLLGVGIGLDATNALATGCLAGQSYVGGSTPVQLMASWAGQPSTGYHYLAWLEYQQNSDAATTMFYGDAGLSAPARVQSGIQATLFA